MHTALGLSQSYPVSSITVTLLNTTTQPPASGGRHLLQGGTTRALLVVRFAESSLLPRNLSAVIASPATTAQLAYELALRSSFNDTLTVARSNGLGTALEEPKAVTTGVCV